MNRARAIAVVLCAAGALAWRCLEPAPALAEEPAAAPPACQGRDLSGDVALRPDALAAARTRRGDQLDNSQGLLWRVEKAGGAASYLFGAIHSTDERALALARAAAAYILSVKTVATELGGPFDKFAAAELGATMMVKALAKESDTLAAIGAHDDRALVEKYLAGRGVDAALAHHLKLWFLAALTAAPACEIVRQQSDFPIVDEFLARTARDLGVKVVAIETIDEQTDVLASVDPALAASILISSARRPELDDDMYATLLGLYAKKDPGEILPVLDASEILTPEESEAEDAFATRLLGARNQVMAERLAPLLDSGPVFVAVGALHLIGRDGLIERLRASGFSVTNVW
ncbi:MAG: TraB/GumN family protein [Roseiarcus sp.]